MLDNRENVARAIFEPKMVYQGRLLAPAFELRPSIREDYLSVVRLSVEGWKDDIFKIPQHKNRRLYGYAELNVGDIRAINLNLVKYDVREVDTTRLASHAGIFITVNGEPLVGGESLSLLPEGVSEDFLLLAIRNRLVNLAQRKLVAVRTEEDRIYTKTI